MLTTRLMGVAGMLRNPDRVVHLTARTSSRGEETVTVHRLLRMADNAPKTNWHYGLKIARSKVLPKP